MPQLLLGGFARYSYAQVNDEIRDENSADTFNYLEGGAGLVLSWNFDWPKPASTVRSKKQTPRYKRPKQTALLLSLELEVENDATRVTPAKARRTLRAEKASAEDHGCEAQPLRSGSRQIRPRGQCSTQPLRAPLSDDKKSIYDGSSNLETPANHWSLRPLNAERLSFVVHLSSKGNPMHLFAPQKAWLSEHSLALRRDDGRLLRRIRINSGCTESHRAIP